jgi:CheY-like chemotaxis protein
MGNAEVALARSGIQPVDTDLNDIIRSAERGSEILQSVVSFARRFDLRPSVLDMHEMPTEMDNMIRRTVPENTDLSISVQPGAWYVNADRGSLEDAILNLVLNARDAMPGGGTTRVYSESGHGTSFQLYLPAVEGQDMTPTEKPMPAGGPGEGRVLLVEDDEDVRRTLRMLLEGAGFKVREAASDDIALTMLDDTCADIDIVLTDVVMPGKLQGPDLVRVIRERRPDIPVVFMSGCQHEANVHGNGIRRTDISLTKPMSRAMLQTALAQALGGAGGGS